MNFPSKPWPKLTKAVRKVTHPIVLLFSDSTMSVAKLQPPRKLSDEEDLDTFEADISMFMSNVNQVEDQLEPISNVQQMPQFIASQQVVRPNRTFLERSKFFCIFG